MQHDFPDLAEDVPEQDLLLSFGPEVFDDYWGELEDMAVGNSEGLATGSLPALWLGFGYLVTTPFMPVLDLLSIRRKAPAELLQVVSCSAPGRCLEQTEHVSIARGLLKNCRVSAAVLAHFGPLAQ